MAREDTVQGQRGAGPQGRLVLLAEQEDGRRRSLGCGEDVLTGGHTGLGACGAL